MIKHIVMWRLKDFAAGASREENAVKLKESLEALDGVIDEIRAIEVGINFNSSPAAFDVVLYSEFDDAEGLEALERIHGAAPGIPVFVMTGFDDEALAGDAKRRGAHGYIVKGRFSAAQLHALLREAVASDGRPRAR